MTEQQACTLCGAGGHLAAQCKLGESLKLLRDLRQPLLDASMEYDEALSPFVGRIDSILASQQGEKHSCKNCLGVDPESCMFKHPEQADGAQGLCRTCEGSRVVSDSDGCGVWYKACPDCAALAQPSQANNCTKPDCFPHCDCGGADDKAQPSPAPELDQLYSMLGVTDQVRAVERLQIILGQAIIVPKLEAGVAELERSETALSECCARLQDKVAQDGQVPEALLEAIKWADHLLFECGALVQTRAPSVHVYNQTYAAVEAAKAVIAAAPAQGGE